jgi:hypothetical protein
VTPAAPPTSTRLRRAAAAERAELARHRERLLGEREHLRAELARIEAGLADIDDRETLLARLAPIKETDTTSTAPTPMLAVAGETGTGAAGALRGPAIREAAVRVLADRPDIEALHYRRWYEMVTAQGFRVAGKDPLAVFLTQLSRSPVIRKGTQAGVYELDRSAVSRLRRELDELQLQLRELTSQTSTADLGAIRERRGALNAEIGQTEKALEEAVRLLGSTDEPRLAATG